LEKNPRGCIVALKADEFFCMHFLKYGFVKKPYYSNYHKNLE
jgi:hypothetical protein